MLPLQITLEGFMSYRDAATFSFEGASLWMLAGQNGAGKSSVFDAMRWTIFNRHRGGGQGHEALIHHEKNKLRVAFDLELAAGRFRLIRTLARGGKSTWQIETLDGEKVPETDMRDGYNRWLSENLGLSDETFCAAFYLAQGKGDAILSAHPEQRYEMLAEIVDLSAYQRLHELAKSKASELESEVRVQRAQFEAAAEAPEGEIELLTGHLERLAKEIGAGEKRQTKLGQWEPWAAQWERLEVERGETTQRLESARQLLEVAPGIERDFGRLLELEALLLPLGQWLQGQQRAVQVARDGEEASQNLVAANEKLGLAESNLKEARRELAALESQRQGHEAVRLEALSRLNELAPLLNEARNLENGQSELASLEAKFAAYPADLEGQKSRLEERIVDAQSQQLALGVLTRFERVRQTWREAGSEEKAAQEKGAQIEVELAKATDELQQWECEGEKSQSELSQTSEVLTASQVRRRDAEEALERFNEVKGEANCYFCGQRLTPEHAAREEKRLLGALEAAREEENSAQEGQKKAQAEQERVQGQIKSRQLALRKFEKELEKAKSNAESAAKARQGAVVTARQTLQELSADFVARFDGQSKASWDESRVLAALESAFPAADDLATLGASAEALLGLQREAKQVASNLEAQNLVAAQVAAIRQQVEPLKLRYSAERLQQIYSEESTQRAAAESVGKLLADAVADLVGASQWVQTAEGDLARAQQERAQWETQRAALAATQTEIERALQAQREGASASLQVLFHRDLDELQSDFGKWSQELEQLATQNLETRVEQIKQSRQHVAELERSLVLLDKSVQQVPLEARRSPQELRHEMEELAKLLGEWGQELRRVEGEKSGLERLIAEKTRLRGALLDVEKRARQHKTLADLLGPQQLQRYLLREAENGIVDEANAILDRISTGALRLELRADDDEIAGARKGPPKILDVAVFQSGSEGITGPAMLPAFLSGSQRFRVAVALALGIGRYATRGQGHSRLEAVIIDEGFGALDKVGRGEMIDELKSLGDELKRVILVSHQEEFAEAFSNRYLIEHDGTASTVRLMVN